MAAAVVGEAYPMRPDSVSLRIVASHILFVLLPVYLAATSPPTAILFLLYLWFGITMQGLLNLMHECAHYHVFQRRRGSDVLGQWILGPLMVADFDKYRRLHWAHHRNLGSDADPKYTYRVEILGWRLPFVLVTCLVGVEAFRKFIYQRGGDREVAASPSSRQWIVRTCLVHTVFGASLVAVAYGAGAGDIRAATLQGAVAYGFVYAYGMMSLTIFVATLRAIAEHQDSPDAPLAVGEAVLRNLKCGPWGRLILGCYGFAEHATHHWEPAIPYYHLERATENLADRDRQFAPRDTYVSVLTAQVTWARTGARSSTPRRGPRGDADGR